MQCVNAIMDEAVWRREAKGQGHICAGCECHNG